MAHSKAVAVLVVALCLVAKVQGQANPLPCQVTFFDHADFSGGGQLWNVDVPLTGCSACVDLNRIRRNSWESFLSSCGDSIVLYDGHKCSGKSSGNIPARSGVIEGSLSNSVDSFALCFGYKAPVFT